MKRVLIISPHFPPINAPDMQRVRMSLPYYKKLGWEPVVICVDENCISGYRDNLLDETIPFDVEIHKVKAWPLRLTRKFGLGSVSLRSYYSFKKKGSELLGNKKFDLIFFSTSLFHVCALGRYWQKKFGVPFIIDMQDPWRNDFPLTKPSSQRQPKFWLDYIVNKKMEAYTMPYVDGVISVSQGYIDTLCKTYPAFSLKPTVVLPFGVAVEDFELVRKKNILPEIITTGNGKINVVYVGVLNTFFLPLIKAFLMAFIQTVEKNDLYHFYFIGTSYSKGNTIKPVEDIAAELNIKHLVTEIPNRIGYFSALSTLLHSDILFIPGLTRSDYNASKVFNNIFTGKPIFSVFNEKSLVKEAIEETSSGVIVGVHENDDEAMMIEKIKKSIPEFFKLPFRTSSTNFSVLKKYSAEKMAEKQVSFFNKVANVTAAVSYSAVLNCAILECIHFMLIISP